MVERIGQREREPEPQFSEVWERHYNAYRQNRAKAEKGKVVLKGRQIPYQLIPQGFVKCYVFPESKDVASTMMSLFEQRIIKHSGRHTHQGGLALFIVEGRGYTVIDGVRHDWKEGDLVLLPIKKGGCEHQHFNLDPDKPSRWLALQPAPLYDLLGNFFHQKEVSPAWKEKYGESWTL